MENQIYVEDIIVPIIAFPKNDDTAFRFLGSGFFINNDGYLLTCKHVTDSVKEGEKLFAYQYGSKKRELDLNIVKSSSKYDISLCQSGCPEIDKFWPFTDETYVSIGSDIEVYSYVYEPIGDEELPFRQRYMKGHVSGLSREKSYPESFELSFPILFGMSGAPLIVHLPIQGESKRKTCIAGLVYGSRESEVVHHTIVEGDGYEERVSKIVELGLSYQPSALFSLFRETKIDFDIDVLSEKNFE